MTEHAPLPPEARSLVLALAPSLRRELATVAPPAAFVVVSRLRAPVDDVVALVGALRMNAVGDRYAAAPLARVRALAEQVAPTVAPRLDEPVAAGQVWCLVLGPSGAGVVPLGWPTSTRRGEA